MMDVTRRPGIRGRRPKKTVNREHFARLTLFLPPAPRKAAPGQAGPLLAFLLLGGFALGVWWPREASRPVPEEGSFVIGEEALRAPLPLEIAPPPPLPTAPSPPKQRAIKEKRPPEPQSRLEEADLSETGDLAAARSNTLDKEAEDAVAPTQSPTSAPVFLDQQPVILTGTPPEYPPRALERGLEATVVALVTIDTNGRVTEARIEQGGGGDFDGPVLDAVRRIRFQPIIHQGRKWPARFRIPYEFKLE